MGKETRALRTGPRKALPRRLRVRKNGKRVAVIVLTLDPILDAPLIAGLESSDNWSATIVNATRMGQGSLVSEEVKAQAVVEERENFSSLAEEL